MTIKQIVRNDYQGRAVSITAHALVYLYRSAYEKNKLLANVLVCDVDVTEDDLNFVRN